MAAEIDTVETDLVDPPPALKRLLFYRRLGRDAGIVDQDGEAALRLRSRGDGALPVAGVGHVMGQHGDRPLGAGGGRLRSGGVDIGRDDMRPLLRKQKRRGAADAGARPRHQRGLAFEPCAHPPSPSR